MSNHGHDHAHDLGLSHDLPLLVERQRGSLGRRSLLSIVGGLGVVAVAGCAADSPSTSDAGTAGSPGGRPPAGGAVGAESSVEVADGEIPEETAGPFPGDGSNGVNALAESGIVRRDIATSFGDASGVAEGVPITIRLKVYDLDGEDATALSGAAVYVWHCDRAGQYSMSSESIVEENYLRGVQETDAHGRVEFARIFPAAYDGRWPHIHFEVYPGLAEATTAASKLRTSQMAIPESTASEVYAGAEGYEQSVVNMGRTSLSSDNVFSDGYSLQMASVTGSVGARYILSLNVPV